MIRNNMAANQLMSCKSIDSENTNCFFTNSLNKGKLILVKKAAATKAARQTIADSNKN